MKSLDTRVLSAYKNYLKDKDENDLLFIIVHKVQYGDNFCNVAKQKLLEIKLN